jgi:hypothetical protein
VTVHLSQDYGDSAFISAGEEPGQFW